MSFANLDNRPLHLPPKMKLAPPNSIEKIPAPDKRTTSLEGKNEAKFLNGLKKYHLPVTTKSPTGKNAAVKPNEYTKTSLDRPNTQERAKQRLILHQQKQQQLHQQQNLPVETNDTTTQKPSVGNLDTSDVVFVNYYKQINSANKTFSTFRGPFPDPKKYLKEEDETLLTRDQVPPANTSPKKSSSDEEDRDKESDYTPLALETNYVKVSPPKLMRRQKKSGGSESDVSNNNVNFFGQKKLKKEKAPSPNKTNKKTVKFNTSDKFDEVHDSSNDSSASDVFTEDLNSIHKFNDENSIENFPPPPPQLLESSSEYISLENAEKKLAVSGFEGTNQKSFCSQIKEVEKIKSQIPSETKTLNKIGTVLPRQILNTKDPDKELSNHVTSKNDHHNETSASTPSRSIMELILTLRVEGSGENQTMTLKESNEMKNSNEENSSWIASNDSYQIKSSIVNQLCEAVTTLAKDQFKNNSHGDHLNTKTNLLYSDQSSFKLPETSNTNSFQNSVYCFTDQKNLTNKGVSKNIDTESVKTNCNGSSKSQCSSEYEAGKIETTADVHRLTEKPSQNYTALDIKGTLDKGGVKDSSQQRYTSIQHQNIASIFKNSNEKDLRESEDDEENYLEKLKASKMTHMNWDDLMQEAHSLGIPLNRPNKLIISNAPSTVPCHIEQNQPLLRSPRCEFRNEPTKFSPTLTKSCPPIAQHNIFVTNSSTTVKPFPTLNKSIMTISKKAAPTLAGHKAALQEFESNCANTNCCNFSHNIYDQPRKYNHIKTNEGNKLCPCNQHSKDCCQPVKSNESKTEKKFYSFRIKLANLFCKRLCGKSREPRKTRDEQACKPALETYKCTCNQSEHLFSSMSSKQLISDKPFTNLCHYEAGLDTESSFSEADLTSRRRAHLTKSFPRVHSRRVVPGKREDEGCGGPKGLHNLQNLPWYWGPIEFEEAEKILTNKKDGSFLVRDSSDSRFIVSLSFRSEGLTHHTRVERSKGRFSLFNHSSKQHKQKISQFILEVMEVSKQGKNLFYLKTPTSAPTLVRLLYPITKH